MAAELIAFSDMLDSAYTLLQELQSLHPEEKILFKPFKDSKSLVDVISKGTVTVEKRLMLDIACPREGYLRHDISDIGLVRSGDNIADVLTKQMNQSALRTMMSTGKVEVEPVHWIISTRTTQAEKDKKEF